MEDGTKKKKKLYKLPLYIIGGITIVFYLLFTPPLLRMGLDDPASLGIVIIFVVVFVITFPYFVFTELSIAGLIVSIVLKKVKGISIWWVIGYIILTVIVIATFVILLKLYTAI